MYTDKADKQKADGQPHVAGAMRQFADGECLKDIAEATGIDPQKLRNKLLLNQPHLLSIHELVKVTKASGNRALVDGILLELNCIPSVSLANLADAEHVSPTDRILEAMTNTAALGDLAKNIRVTGRVTERMRHSVMNRATRVMQELAIFAHEVEAKFQAVPVLTVASDAMQGMPIPGLM